MAKGWQRGVAVLGVDVKHKGGGVHDDESVAGDAAAKEESVCIHH